MFVANFSAVACLAAVSAAVAIPSPSLGHTPVPAGAVATPTEDDTLRFKMPTVTFMTVIVAIDRADAQSGATEVFPGYHQQGWMTEADGTFHHLPDDAVDPARGVMLDLAPGDVALFQRIHAAPLGVERIDTLAAAALSELQPPERRRRAARGPLRRMPRLAADAVRGLRQGRELLPLMPCAH